MTETKKQSPYQKYRKMPFRYDGTPLNKDGEGVKVTPENVAKFEARLGISRNSRGRVMA